jgi:hypothetical protein
MSAVGAIPGRHYIGIAALGAGNKKTISTAGAEPLPRFIRPAAAGAIDYVVGGFDLVLVLTEPAQTRKLSAVRAKAGIRRNNHAAFMAGNTQSCPAVDTEIQSRRILFIAFSASNSLLHNLFYVQNLIKCQNLILIIYLKRMYMVIKSHILFNFMPV